MARLTLSPDVAALNPALGQHAAKLALLDGDGYKSELERRVAREWVPLQAPSEWWYEPITFKLPGGRYTPDFLLRDMQGRDGVSFVEVKGWTKSYRADRRAFREAARIHRSWARWCWLTWDAGWQEEWL